MFVRTLFVGLLILPLTAYGYGQAVLGTRLQVANPGASAARKVTIRAKETSSDDTVIGDPTVAGAEVIVTLGGGTPSSQTFLLATGTSTATGTPFWSGDAAHGFTYKDPQGQNGAVVASRIRLVKGTFLITTKMSGKSGTLSLVPPNPGSSGCVTFHIMDGDIYHLSFATGRVTNRGARLFRVSRPTSEGSCVGAVTTTSTSSSMPSTSSTSTTLASVCGNGVIDPGEMCDGEPFCTPMCEVEVYTCCQVPNAPECTGVCSPVGMSCLACAPNTMHLGSHPQWTGPCPGAGDRAGTGTCAPPDPVGPLSVCCSLVGGGCWETAVTTTAELQSAVILCVYTQGTSAPVIGTCVAGACVPAH
jgi:hypothetical protein